MSTCQSYERPGARVLTRLIIFRKAVNQIQINNNNNSNNIIINVGFYIHRRYNAVTQNIFMVIYCMQKSKKVNK